MAYTPQEKKDFVLKDARAAIGMGMGNALAKAVDLVISFDIKEEDDIWNKIVMWRDRIFEDNQKRIQEEFEKWLKENQEQINASLGITDEVDIKPL